MKHKVLPREELGERLNAWNHALLEQNFDKAEDIHKSIAHMFATLIEDDHHHLLYLILEVRLHLMKDQFSLARTCLSATYPHLLDEPLLYYYHFFKGMIASSERNYSEAITQYKIAEDHLKYIDDKVERAEFYYQVSGAYYYMVHTWESIDYLKKAQYIYKTQKSLDKRIASCSVLLGLNCIDIKQYEQAEVEFLNALDFAKKTEDINFKIDVYHNLGLFYANQNHSSIALRYLNEAQSLSKKRGNLRIIFLLAQEHCKLGHYDEAIPYYEEGTRLSEEKNDEEYIIKFQILYELYFQNDPSHLMESLDKAIKYFGKNEKWYSVQKYSEILAESYKKNRKYKQASLYYSTFVDACHKINEMGALK